MKKNTEIVEVVQNYKGFEIKASREMSLGGDELLYYSIFRDEDGWELDGGFSYGDETPLEFSNYLRDQVEYYLEHPEEWEDKE